MLRWSKEKSEETDPKLTTGIDKELINFRREISNSFINGEELPIVQVV